MWLTSQEQRTLAVLALVGLAGLGMLGWQRLRPYGPIGPEGRHALTIAGAPASQDAVQWNVALDETRRVNVNTAGVEALERLPEIGPSLARRIAAYRQAHGPFSSADELQQVPGIGPKTYETLKEYVTTE